MAPSSTDARPVLVNDREQLIYLLSEAAEIEHTLMCSYLYACWSLKERPEESITEAQLQAVGRWRKAIYGVAIEEMLHLAIVNNLLISIGAPPHFSRPNFPLAPGYFPSSVVARLTPFTPETADHFIYLERPEGKDLPQASGFESTVAYERGNYGPRLTPTAEEYDTVSHLYTGIEDGFRHLAEKIGGKNLFLGQKSAQVDRSILAFDGLITIAGLDDACTAIGTIVEQGEGGRQDAEQSHYAQFLAIRREYDSLLAEDPEFVPYRSVVEEPIMFRPITEERQSWVTEPMAAKVLDIADAAYGLMLRLLASGFGAADGNPNTRKREIDSAIAVMSVVKTLATSLTSMPANQTGRRAGMNFHLPRSTLALPQARSGEKLLAERMQEIMRAIADPDIINAVNGDLSPRFAAVLEMLSKPK
jgi:hypothetical protein